jgi:acyl dehydratase
MALYFEDLTVGMRFETARRTITEADLVNFSGVSGDFNPLHTDEEFARRSIYGRRIAHGALMLAYMSRASTTMTAGRRPPPPDRAARAHGTVTGEATSRAGTTPHGHR